MFKVNQDYLKLPGSYLFSTVARKQREYQAAHPEAEIIKLSIGDVTQPLAPAIVEALHGAVDEMAHAETFHGYAPDLGYEFLRSAMAKNDYQAKGCDINADEIFISDGAKEDCGNIQEIFSKDSIGSMAFARIALRRASASSPYSCRPFVNGFFHMPPRIRYLMT